MKFSGDFLGVYVAKLLCVNKYADCVILEYEDSKGDYFEKFMGEFLILEFGIREGEGQISLAKNYTMIPKVVCYVEGRGTSISTRVPYSGAYPLKLLVA